jgi:uncharacterized iron-regulated protein
MRVQLRILLLATLLSSGGSPASGATDGSSEPIIRAQDRAEISRAELIQAMSGARVVYLGEKHDADRHHELQLEVLGELVRAGRRPAVGFEAFALAETSVLVDYVLAEANDDPDRESSIESRLIEAIGGDRSNEGRWARYGELLRFARRHRLAVFGADLPRALSLRIGRSGVEGLTPVERRLLFDTGFEDASYERVMHTITRRAHCGWGSPEYLHRMYQAWLARNDTMSMAISVNLEDAPVVMVLGAGHVLYDMGVYERVQHRNPGIRQLNLAFRDRTDAERPAAEQLRLMPESAAGLASDHQYIWFTRSDGESQEDRCRDFLRARQPQHSKSE